MGLLRPARRPLAGLALVALLAGCASLRSQPPDDSAPWKVGGSSVVITAAPDAGGALSYRNCPTLAEATAAVPRLVRGPDANAVPFKTMVLQCSYYMDELDVQFRPAGIAILVFDASAEGTRLWDSVRSDSGFPSPTEIPGLAEVAFATGEPGHYELWVVQGDYGFHMSHLRPSGIPLDQMVALARAMLTGLGREPR